MWEQVKLHPIRFFALLCVAAISVYLGYLANSLLDTLASPGWCGKAIQAEKISPGNTFVGLTTCVNLLTIQLKAMAVNSHIVIGTFSFSLVVLMVIVVAKARASGEIPGGGKFDIAPQTEPLPVKVVNPPSAPVPTAEAKPTAAPPAGPGNAP